METKHPSDFRQERADNPVSPERVILQLYDMGIEGCENRDKVKTIQIISQLMKALNFEYEEIARSFYDLYQYALQMVQNGNFEQALTMLNELRDVWEKSVIARESVS